MDIAIRLAEPADAPAIEPLVAQLGYAVPLALIETHLACKRDDRVVFVAVAGDAVVGLTSVSAAESLVSGLQACIEGLVVEENVRNRGVGERLLDAAERWAREQGCPNLVVRSNVIRERAHRFYERSGFATIKSQRYFRKQL